MISNWREELREVVDEIESKAEKKVKEGKGINNKIIINPKLGEAVEQLGGELLEVTEVDKKEEPKEDPSLKQKEKMASQMKKRVLLQKLRAVRSTGGADIMASHEPEGEVVVEKDLNAAERRALPNKDFVFPGKGEGPEGKQRGAYPINDKKHARAALAMAAAHASPEKEAKVKAVVKKKYPDIEVSEGVMKFVKDRIGKKKTEKKAQKATDAGAVARRKLQQKDHEKVNFLPMEEGKGYQPEIEHSKLGDAKKKKDKERESKLPPHLQGDAIGKMKKAFASEAVKGQDREMRKMAAQDRAAGKDKRLTVKQGRRSVKPVRYRYNEGEDKAFNFVLDKIKKEVGKDGYVSKDNPRKPQSAADKAKARAHQAKVDKENAAERSKDPSQGRYPKG